MTIKDGYTLAPVFELAVADPYAGGIERYVPQRDFSRGNETKPHLYMLHSSVANRGFHRVHQSRVLRSLRKTQTLKAF